MAALAAATFGCSQPVPQTAGTPDPSLNTWLAQDTAFFLCRYSRSSFPAWTLWEDYADFLTPEEAQAVEFIANKIENQFSAQGFALYKSVERFIADNTLCETELGDAAFKSSQNDRYVVRFIQKIPVVPNVPPPVLPENPELWETAWLEALNAAFSGEYDQTQAVIPLQKNESGRYFMPTQIASSYATPMTINDFYTALDSLDFQKAKAQLAIVCAQENPHCAQLERQWTSAIRFQNRMMHKFREDVEVSQIKAKTIAMTGNRQYTSVEMTLTNRGNHTFSQIVFKTPEAMPQFCDLQSKKTLKNDAPLTLHPGETAKGWCALRDQTPPEIVPEYWISG